MLTQSTAGAIRQARPLSPRTPLHAFLFLGLVAALGFSPERAEAAEVLVTTKSNAGAGSLRAAIDFANANPGTDIRFQIPAAAINAGGVFIIQPSSPLPTITADDTRILGNTQTAFTGNTNPEGPEIVLSGINAGANADGLRINAALCVIQRLVIQGFDGNGVLIHAAGSDANAVWECYIGTDPDGMSAVPNRYGVYLSDGAQDNLIGGTPAQRNVISGNLQYGVAVRGNQTETNTVQGNRIGTNRSGTAALPNGIAGVMVWDDAEWTFVRGNILSGNDLYGVGVSGAGTRWNMIEGNHIGVNTAGTSALPNGAAGVIVTGGSTLNRVGGFVAGVRNVVSGNGTQGVWIRGAGTRENWVSGNYIGTNAEGSAAIPNGTVGILLDAGASDNFIGLWPGNAAGVEAEDARNVISGNGATGVDIAGAGTSDNMVGNNYIGTDATGEAALPNGTYGVYIRNGAAGNIIGGNSADERNVISGNGAVASSHNVRITGGGTGWNVVQGNYIGTDKDGQVDLWTTGYGVSIAGGAQDCMVGGWSPSEGNVISGHSFYGVSLSGDLTRRIDIFQDKIGTNAAGNLPLGNGYGGISLTGNTDTNSIYNNRIAHNGGDGVYVGQGVGNSIRVNQIFSNAGLGINLRPVGEAPHTPTANGAAFGISAFPTITAVTVADGKTTVSGVLNGGVPGQQYWINAYRSTSKDPSGYGEGQVPYFNFRTVVANNQGKASYSLVLDGAHSNWWFSVTATMAANRSTSEFSNAKKASLPIGFGG